MDPELLERAAAARAAQVAGHADRPAQRRCAQEAGSGPRVSARISRMQLRAAGDSGSLDFEGFASVTGIGYEMWDMFGPYTETVSVGAFQQTLARSDLDCPLVLQHQDLRRIARTTNGSLLLSEVTAGDPTGLLVQAPQLDPADQDVAYIAPKLRSGLVDEMSFKFVIVRGQWSPDWMEYHIDEADLHRGDVAIVGYGANPYTAGAGLRQAELLDVLRSLDESNARTALTVLRSRLEPSGSRPRRGLDVVTTDDELLLPRY